jgi:hypothetical protein
MPKTQRDKFDLFTLCCKGKIIGTEIQMDDDSWEEVQDWYADFKTGEIHIEFVSGEEGSFNLGDKFIVKIDNSYNKISSKKKKKRHKRG